MTLRFSLSLLLGLLAVAQAVAQPPKLTAAERRERGFIIAHRGSWEFAHENTMEAYRATSELGADGNELDVRQTSDGVLVMFHDDMLDWTLNAYGDVSDYTWAELQQFEFRDPGPFGRHTRIPTLREVLRFHKQHGLLFQLDFKQPNTDKAIADLLTELNVWENLVLVSPQNSEAVRLDPRYKEPGWIAPLYENRRDMDDEQFNEFNKRKPAGYLVDDPRWLLTKLGRPIGKVSSTPYFSSPKQRPAPSSRPAAEWLRSLDAIDRMASDTVEDRAQQIYARANIVEQLLAARAATPAVFARLERMVRERSVHSDWRVHGADGSAALRALILMGAPNAGKLAREVIWSDREDLERLRTGTRARASADWRMKGTAWSAMLMKPPTEAGEIAYDYLALPDAERTRLGFSNLDQATRLLIRMRPNTETVATLIEDPRHAVRVRAVLEAAKKLPRPWAEMALRQTYPAALNWTR